MTNSGSGGLRVVVVNHNSGSLLKRCIEDLLAMDWSGACEVVIVDSASTDDSLASVSHLLDHEHPRLRTIRLSENVGFGANNEALTDLKDVDWVALVNPDAFVPRNFASGLVASFDHPSIGAASPKILFDDRHRSLRATTGHGQDVRLTKVEIDGVDVFHRCHVLGAGAERIATSAGASWHLGPSSDVLIPALGGDSESSGRATLFLQGTEPTTVVLRDAGHEPVAANVGSAESAAQVTLSGSTTQYIQNAGSWVDANGIGGNRGYFEPDDGRFAESDDVFAWCGAAVMLRADYLNDVGLFDPDYFLYYEDTDLSWRGQSRGWTYRYTPDVAVRHRHSASTGQGSALTDVYQQRNRLRMLARNASAPVLARGVIHSVGAAAKIGGRQIAAMRNPGSKGDSTLFARRAKGIALAFGDLAELRRARKELTARREVPTADVEQHLGR